MKRSFLTSLFIIFAIVITGAVLGGRSALIKSTVYAQSVSQPELPRVYLDTACPTTTGAVFNLNSGGDLQFALNAAQPGDTIVLQAGAVFTGNFTMPAKSGNGW